ncbi:MAG: MoxR family ATPase [Deltaproteobacteria bacterium]
MSLRFLPDDLAGNTQALPALGGRLPAKHLFEEGEVESVNVALAAGRPLLLRGDPGTGKSQIARAVAACQGWPLVHHVLDAESGPRDLLYTIDSVGRLAAAQIAGVSGKADAEERKNAVDLTEFVEPGPLWWAFDFGGAESVARKKKVPRPEGWTHDAPVVVLVDEIDKADPSVPNGLLGALGDSEFFAPDQAAPVACRGAPPLVVITTNAERPLPLAFLRRCVVYEIQVPKEREALRAWLQVRGAAHFGGHLGEALLKKAAEVIANNRVDLAAEVARPGLAEYLDLLRALHVLRSTDKERLEIVERLAKYVSKKGPSRR